MNSRTYRRNRNDAGWSRASIRLLAASTAAVLVFGAVRARAQSDDRPTASASTLESISPPATGDWERVDGASADAPAAPDDSSSNQVLEVPQVIDRNTASAGQADDGGDPTAADPGDAQQQADAGADAPDEIGSINDYQSQQNEVGPAAVALPPMAMPRVMGPRIGLNPMMPMAPLPYVPPAGLMPGGMLPPGPVIIRPGVTGYIPPSSPMFMAPRPMGPIPGGWWNRVHH